MELQGQEAKRPVSTDAPEPGRPGSLGREKDLLDAAAVLEVVNASYLTLQQRQQRGGPLRLVREAVWFLWEQPRLPKPLIENKYPLDYPWSLRAQEAFASFYKRGSYRPPGGWGLVIEHLYPRELLVKDLVMLVAECRSCDEPAEPKQAVELLTSRLMAAVVGRYEDRQLLARRESPQIWGPYELDPWLRYRSTALDPADFKTVDEEIRWGSALLMRR